MAFSTNVKCNLSYRIIPSQKIKIKFDQIKKPIQRKNWSNKIDWIKIDRLIYRKNAPYCIKRSYVPKPGTSSLILIQKSSIFGPWNSRDFIWAVLLLLHKIVFMFQEFLDINSNQEPSFLFFFFFFFFWRGNNSRLY